jgi:hypothetical protein
MEMRNGGRLRKQQYSRAETGYPASPASTICLGYGPHQIIAGNSRALRRRTRLTLSAFTVPVNVGSKSALKNR